MASVLAGFCTIWIVIAVGFVLAQLKVFDTAAQVLLSRVSFFIGSPALLFTVMAETDLRRLFAGNLVAQVGATLASAAIYLAVDAWRWHSTLARKVIGAFCASYVNAGNLGLPIAAYVLGDVGWVAPVLLVQVLVLQPVGLTLLDVEAARTFGRPTSWLANLTMPLRNPMTIGVIVGLVVNLTGLRLPSLLLTPLQMLAALAVPTMLVAFGIALRLGPLPGRSEDTTATVVASVLKLVVQPLLGFVIARSMGLSAVETLAVTVVAGLPTAQNVFVLAVRYERALVLARDGVFITTIASIPTIIAIAALLG